MGTESRTVKAARNVAISLLCQCVAMVVQFLGRRIFIDALGAEYLGVGGLFTNVLTILSFAELGIGSAMVFSMYRPLAENDTEKLKSLMLLYRRAYFIIGITVAGVGLCLVPFLGWFMGEAPTVSESPTVLYLFFLFNSAVSYFFVYRKSIITADQKLYLVNLYDQIAAVVRTALQCILLYITHSFLLYLTVQIVFTVVGDLWVSHRANRLYPFLKEKASPLPKEETKRIFGDVRALAVYKFCSVALNGTDNILVSKLFDLVQVGLISNFTMLSTLFTTVLGRVTESFTAGLGNLNINREPEHQHRVFRKLFLLCAWMFGLASVGMYLFANQVITLWLGAEYCIDRLTVIALVCSFYVSSVQYAPYSFRTTMGLFRQGMIAPAVAAVVNIGASILFARWWGLCGIFFATVLARFGVVGVVDAVLIYRHRFHRSPLPYFLRYFGMAGLLIVLSVGLEWVIGLISVGGWFGLILKIIIVTVLYNALLLAVFCRNRAFLDLAENVRHVVERILSRITKRKGSK